MSKTSVLLCLTIGLVSIPTVFNDILCKDSVIDSLVIMRDSDMIFFTIGQYFWHIKASNIPPKKGYDAMARRLPKAFKNGVDALIYIDGINGCKEAKASKSLMASGETKAKALKDDKHVWALSSISGTNKFMKYDTIGNVWVENTLQNYDKNHCIKDAKIDMSNGKTVDGVLTRNHFELFFIQNKSYAMVNCLFMCTEESAYGKAYPKYSLSDFDTNQKVYAMVMYAENKFYIFHEKTYFEASMAGNPTNGKVKVTKSPSSKNILKDFLKLSEPGECTTMAPDAASDDPPVDGEGEGGGGGGGGGEGSGEGGGDVPPNETEGGSGENAGASDGEEKKGSTWLIIFISIIVMIII